MGSDNVISLFGLESANRISECDITHPCPNPKRYKPSEQTLINKTNYSDRYPSAPIIVEGFPRNQTVLENSTVMFECPLISDLGVHVEWAKFKTDSTTNATIPKNISKFEVIINF